MQDKPRDLGGHGKVKEALYLLSFLFFIVFPMRMFGQPDAPKSDTPVSRHRLSSVVVIPEDFSTLKLAPGFLLNMDVYDTPELSGDFRIDSKGDITIPTAGHIHVAEETLREAAARIEDRLRDGKILNDPQVNLNIAQYAGQNVTVLGEVHEPGRLELLAPHTLVDILALAGGETQYAGNTIEIQRVNGSKIERIVIPYFRDKVGEVGVHTVILPGDIVTIPRAGVVYVLGAVNRAGGFLMQDDGELDVTQALSLADGTQLQAAVGSMRLIRRLTDGKVEEMPIPYSDIVHGKAASPRLQADDVIYVPMSKFKVILGAALLQSAANAAIYIR